MKPPRLHHRLVKLELAAAVRADGPAARALAAQAAARIRAGADARALIRRGLDLDGPSFIKAFL